MNKPTITISNAAKTHIENFLNDTPGAIGFRFGITKSGCSGFAYIADIATEQKADEQQLQVNGVTLLMNQTSINTLAGTHIDLVKKELGQKQLAFENPNIEDSCGCGESFTLKAQSEK